MSDTIRRILLRQALAIPILLATVAILRATAAESSGMGGAVFVVAVLLAAWWGGLGPALLVTGALAWGAWSSSPPGQRAGQAAPLAAIGVAVGLFAEAMHAARRRAEREARERSAHEARYREIVELAEEGVWTLDAGGRTDYINPRMARMLGREPAEVLGRSPLEFVDERDQGRAAIGLERRRRGVAEAYEIRYLRKDGSTLAGAVTANPIFDGDGRYRGALAVVSDATERRGAEDRLRSERDFAAAVLETAGCLVVVLDREGRIVRFNRAAQDLTGYGAEEVLGRPPWEVFLTPEAAVPVREGFARLVASGGSSRREYDWRDRSGRSHTIAWSHATLPDARGGVEHVVATGIDVTERRRAERLLRDAVAAAEAASRSKDQFFAAISHELRTPLTPALLAVSGLLDDPDTPESCREPLEAARRGIALEARLVDDLLDIARIGAGKLRLERARVDGHAVVRQALAACEADLREGGLALDLDLSAGEHYVEADAGRLQQVIWNLVKNAVKFSPPGSTVAVRSRHEPDCRCRGVPGCFVVEVADTGVGIEPELLPKIFDAFEQGGEGRQIRSGGLGLGLAIGRSIAEAHGGRLSAASDGPGRGATFALHLGTVAAPAQANGEATPPAESSPDRPLRILLVEDDATTLRSLARLLGRRGSAVVTAASLASARAAAESGPFDVLVCDLGLPDGSGLDLLRGLPGRRPPPAIALTGYGMEDDVLRCRDAGFAAHLTKPIELADLEAAIRKVTASGEN